MDGFNEFYKSILAGNCISIACIIYLSISNKIIGSLLFSTGLYIILAYKLNLFTGKIGLVKSLDDVINSLIYFIGNILGCAFIYLIMIQTPIFENIKEQLLTIANYKKLLSTPELFFLGVLCGILMLFATKSEDSFKSILPLLCVSAFILIGAEHSVADVFYLFIINDANKYTNVISVVALGNAIGAIFANLLLENVENVDEIKK